MTWAGPAGGDGEELALGEQGRINSCSVSSVASKGRREGPGYISLVYSAQNDTLNPDGVNNSVERGQSVLPLRMGAG